MAATYGEFYKQVRAELEQRMRQQLDQNLWVAAKTGRITGQKASGVIVDDMYPYGNEYERVSHMIQLSLQHLRRAVENIESIRNTRFRSPYSPKRWIAWFQKRDKKFWNWVVASPALAFSAFGGGVAAHELYGWFGVLIFAYLGIVVGHIFHRAMQKG